LTKCIFEASHKELFEKNITEDNREWLERQLVSDMTEDADMDNFDKISDYDYTEEDIEGALEDIEE